MSTPKKEIAVCCAIIENNGDVLITQRSETMSLPLKWEFPGGKLEPNEAAEVAICREIEEELAIKITVNQALTPVRHDYGTFIIQLIPFVCSTDERHPRLIEHKAFRWEKVANLLDYDWAPADIPIVKEYMALWK